MPIFNSIDVGQATRNQGPSSGQEVGRAFVEGTGSLAWPRGFTDRQRSTVVNVQAPTAIGGQAAYSKAATALVVQQLVELANNRNAQTVYIQWSSGNGILVTNPFDGWYILNDVTPLEWYWNNHVPCQVTATFVAPPPPTRVALSYSGGSLASNYSGLATNLLSLPVGSTASEASVTRTGGEGAIPCILSPVASPEPVLLSTTIANLFKGGVHVYDTINTGSNAVPTTGGTFVHANWVEVFGTDHDFVGDCVITNGLQLLLFQTTTVQICTAYLWNTALATANWQQYATIVYVDNAGNGSTCRSYSLLRVGGEECSIAVTQQSTGSQMAGVTLRLQRGRYEVRTDVRALTQANTGVRFLMLGVASAPKIAYNESTAIDNPISGGTAAATTTYGYAAAFPASTSFPFIAGFLYQNPPAAQPGLSGSNTNIDLNDTSGPALNAQRSYGFFAVPYGVSGSYSTANLQAEAESGTLGTGWTSVADAAGSAGNTAKCASGTASGNADTFGTSFSPAAGTYDVWYRVRVTSNASGTAQMQFGYRLAGVDTLPVALAPSNFLTTYTWIRAATALAISGAQTFRFLCQSGPNVLATDFFVDEAALVPKTLTTANTGPQETWQQFMYDRSTEIIQQ